MRRGDIMMRMFRRKRTYKLLFLIIAAALVYLGFQIFSVRLLTKQNVQTANHIVERHANEEQIAKEKYVADMEERKYHDKDESEEKPTPDMPERQFHIPDIPEETLKFPHKQEPDDPDETVKETEKVILIKDTTIVGVGTHISNGKPELSRVRPSDVPRGVDPEKVGLYKQDGEGNFVCLTSKEKIPFNQLNDDYCDCKDGSDEPGTSACLDMRFFCDYQVIAQPYSIFSSAVNDGICDCCDGSDEWGNVTVMEAFKINDNKHYPVSHAPCKNTCHTVEQKLLAQHKLQRAGQVVKNTYLLLASERKKSEDISRFGPHGVFYKLSINCYKYKAAEYEYTLCPWKDVRQQAFPQPSKCLGRNASWLSKSNGVYKLQMVGGDRELCPGHSDRRSIITFTCGLEDKIMSIYENERCKYSIDFITPAAC